MWPSVQSELKSHFHLGSSLSLQFTNWIEKRSLVHFSLKCAPLQNTFICASSAAVTRYFLYRAPNRMATESYSTWNIAWQCKCDCPLAFLAELGLMQKKDSRHVRNTLYNTIFSQRPPLNSAEISMSDMQSNRELLQQLYAHYFIAPTVVCIWAG